MKPQPTALRILRGNPSKLPLPANEPQPKILAIVPEPPTWLGEVGQSVWREEAPKLHALGLLTAVDLRALALYCEAWEELFEARKSIESHGLIATSEKGGEYQHPAVGIKNKAIQRIKQFGAEFGMTPSSRTSVTASKTTETPKSKHFA
ncbi:MAG: phage terminase small subunit P27 family [Planctomycetes bacterium]|nr:phage terminase small subunit P27 family [Planctomycetota bacterium]